MKLKQRTPILEYDEYDLIDDKILKIRGISEDYKFDFLVPNKKYLNNPYEMKNMELAVETYIDAIANDKNICIYGDPDTDGCTSTAEVSKYTSIFSNNVTVVIPQRKEGHGIKTNKIPKNTDLLIIVDSSTNSLDECKELSKTMNIIILDHHEQEVDNTYAIVVNPHQKGCDYPNKHLSGSGVVYQFCRAVDIANNSDFATMLSDLCMVGLVGDMMDMQSMENRYLVKLGLDCVTSKLGNKGLLALFKMIKKEYQPTSQDISFYIAPLINAVIRLDDIDIITRLFSSDDDSEIKELCKYIQKVNEDRKQLTEEIVSSIDVLNDNKVVVVDMTDSGYKKAMFGLIANNLTRIVQKPVFVGKVKDGVFRGSGRGYGEEIQLKDELNKSGLFLLAQGHQNSFGIQFEISKLDEIYSYFNIAFKEYYNEQYLEYDLELDYEDLNEFNLKLIDDLSEIVGQGFGKPMFYVKNIPVDEYKKISDGKHTKLTTKDDMELNIMLFNNREELDKYKECDYVNVVGSIGLNKWYNFGKKDWIVSKQILAEEIICEKYCF